VKVPFEAHDSEIRLSKSVSCIACSAAPVHVAETPCTASYMFAGDGDHFPSNGAITILITRASSTTTISAGFTVVFDGSPHGVSANVTGAGGLSQSVPVTYTPGGSTVPLNPGSYTAMATFAGDSDHLGSSSGSVTINITFNASCAAGPGDAILPPINNDGTSVYQRKGGSTIPVKFRVCGANGNGDLKSESCVLADWRHNHDARCRPRDD